MIKGVHCGAEMHVAAVVLRQVVAIRHFQLVVQFAGQGANLIVAGGSRSVVGIERWSLPGVGCAGGVFHEAVGLIAQAKCLA